MNEVEEKIRKAIEIVKKKERGEVDKDGREIVSRMKAEVRGWDKFYTGEPCKYGHVAERYVIGGGCVECRKERYRRDVGRI